MKKSLTAAGLIVLVVIGMLVFTLSNINSIMKTAIEVVGSEILQAPVTVDVVDVALVSGTGQIRELKVGNPRGFKGDYAIHIETLLIELEVESIYDDKLHIRDVVIDSPSIIFAGNLSENNLQQLSRNAERYGDDPTAGERGETSADTSDSSGDVEPSDVQSVQIDHLLVRDADISVLVRFLDDEILSVILPSLELADLGKDKDLSAAEVLQAVLASLSGSIVPLVQSNAEHIENQLKAKEQDIKKALEEEEDKLQGEVDKLEGEVDKLKKLFRRR